MVRNAVLRTAVSPLLLHLAVVTIGGANGSPMVRHHSDTSPLEIDVDAMSTYNEKYMELMQSPCRPELDGYFGATYGDPIELQYGFKIETSPLASISDIMDVIEDKIVDTALSAAFPKMCGFRRRLSEASSTSASRELSTMRRISGFRFLHLAEAKQSCQPEINQINFCGVFKGTIDVFGREHEAEAVNILNEIDNILDNMDTDSIHKDLVMLESMDKLHSVHQGTRGDDGGISSIGKAGIALAGLISVSGLLWFFIYRQKRSSSVETENLSPYSEDSDYRRKQQQQGLITRVRTFMGTGSPKRSTSDFAPEERSINKPPSESEAVDFGAGSTLLLTDGRPIEIEFDRSHSTSHYADPASTSHYAEHSLDPRAEGII